MPLLPNHVQSPLRHHLRSKYSSSLLLFRHPRHYKPPSLARAFSALDNVAPESVQNHRRLRDLEKSLVRNPNTGSVSYENPNAFAGELITVEDAETAKHYKTAHLQVQKTQGGSLEHRKSTRPAVPGQVLYPAEKEDVEILSQSTLQYPSPRDVEGGVIIRLVRLSDPVTSPVARSVRNAQVGIRGSEKWTFLGIGLCCVSIVWSFGFWQLERMKWKRDLIELRKMRLRAPRIKINNSPFPWSGVSQITDENGSILLKEKTIQDFNCRVVEARGVFDHKLEQIVGPRAGEDEIGNSTEGYLVVTPLRLEDGSTLLVNRGFQKRSTILDRREKVQEAVEWVRIRGVLESGEIPNLGEKHAIKNDPVRGEFMYLIPQDLAINANARNFEECSTAILTAYDVFRETSENRHGDGWLGRLSGGAKSGPGGYSNEKNEDAENNNSSSIPPEHRFKMRQKGDFLLFWADEHTNFNYAMQWFGMGIMFFGITVYKFVEFHRWRW